MDLQELTRMKDVYKDISSIIDSIGKLQVFPPLGWVWTWDVTLSTYRDFQQDPEYCVTVDEEELWEQFWVDADKNGFSLEYGSEDLYEAVRDWLIDCGAVEEYNEWEDEEDSDEESEEN